MEATTESCFVLIYYKGIGNQQQQKRCDEIYQSELTYLHVQEAGFYFLLLPIRYKTSPTINATTMIPVHMPALKMPSMASQLLSDAARIKRNANDERFI